MKEIYKALLRVQKKLKNVKKDEENPYYHSTYVSLAAVRDSVIEHLSNEGLVLLQPTKMLDGKLVVETQIIHADSNEMITSITPVIVKNESDPQQMGSGVSYARRYALMSLLCLAAEDDDGNAANEKAPSNGEKKGLVKPQGKTTLSSFKDSVKQSTDL